MHICINIYAVETTDNCFVLIRTQHGTATASERNLDTTLFTTLNTSEVKPKAALNLNQTPTM